MNPGLTVPKKLRLGGRFRRALLDFLDFLDYNEIMRIKIWVLAVSVFVLFTVLITARDDPVRQLESRLKNSKGPQRLQLLKDLIDRCKNKNLEKALKYAREALPLVRDSRDKDALLNHLLKLSSIAYRHGEYKKVLLYAEEAEVLCRQDGQIRDMRKYARAVRYKGRGHKYLANYDIAIRFMNQALEIYRDLDDQREVASTLNDIGLVYRRLNDYTRALDYILNAGRIFEKLNDPNSTTMILNNVGLIYVNMNDDKTALNYFIRCRDIDLKTGNLKSLSIVQSNIASIYNRQGRQKEALALLKKNLAWEEQMGRKKRIGNILINIGLLYKHKKEMSRAAGYFVRALNIKEEINEYFGIADSLLELGSIHRETGNLAAARKELDRALKLAVKIRSPVFTRDAYFQIAELYEQQNRHALALDYYKKFKLLDEKIFNQANSNKIAQLQTRLDMERQEKTITLLKKDKQIQDLDLHRQRSQKNWLLIVSVLVISIAFVTYTRFQLKTKATHALTESEEKFRTLSEQLSEKVEERTHELKQAQDELVRKERLSVLGQLTATVAHEVRTPLAAVRSSVFSIEKALENSAVDRIPRALQLAERNIVRCDNIVDDLLNFTRRREPKPEDTDIGQWLTNLLDEYRLPEAIRCERELQAGVCLRIDKERLFRAVVNVLQNASYAMLEHSGPIKRLTVKTVKTDDRLKIYFTDTGPGITAENLDKIFEPLFSTKHFGFGLGLPVVKNIMTEHGGGVEVTSQPGKGTTVTLWLPSKQTT